MRRFGAFGREVNFGRLDYMEAIFELQDKICYPQITQIDLHLCNLSMNAR